MCSVFVSAHGSWINQQSIFMCSVFVSAQGYGYRDGYWRLRDCGAASQHDCGTVGSKFFFCKIFCGPGILQSSPNIVKDNYPDTIQTIFKNIFFNPFPDIRLEII